MSGSHGAYQLISVKFADSQLQTLRLVSQPRVTLETNDRLITIISCIKVTEAYLIINM